MKRQDIIQDGRKMLKLRQAKKELKRGSAQGSRRYESWIPWDGLPFVWTSCNTVTCDIQACSQRSCVSSETSHTDTLQCSQKYQQQGSRISFTTDTTWWTVIYHQGIRWRLWHDDIICCQMIVHDCAVISSHVSSSFPHSTHYIHSHAVSLHGVTLSL